MNFNRTMYKEVLRIILMFFRISLFVIYLRTYLFQMMFIWIRIIRVGCGVYLDTINFLNLNEVVVVTSLQITQYTKIQNDLTTLDTRIRV